jgi:signal recognition particle subunit SRP19
LILTGLTLLAFEPGPPTHTRFAFHEKLIPSIQVLTPYTNTSPNTHTETHPCTMPTVEDYFDDDTDLPLPSSSTSKVIPNTGHHGALLEEINTDDPDEAEIDFSLLADQGRGVFGEGSTGAPPDSGKGKMTARPDAGDLRPSGASTGAGAGVNPNTPMGGFMGDMMRMQQVEDERLEKLRKQFGNASVAADPSVFKA